MKRDNQGKPVPVVNRWPQPTLSCLACREKKRRCDRMQPCSNCVQRRIQCEYAGLRVPVDTTAQLNSTQRPNSYEMNRQENQILQSQSVAYNSDELLYRIRRLEELFAKRQKITEEPLNNQKDSALSEYAADRNFGSHYVTPFGAHLLFTEDGNERSLSIYEIMKRLPPFHQAKELFDHFALTLQPTFGVLHIPTARTLMETCYQCMVEGEEPHAADLMLVFGIFAGSALTWTPRLLDKLATSKAGAKAAFMAYTRTALAMIEHPDQIIQPSTTALVGMGVLGHSLMNTDGFPIKVHLIRHRCLLMSRDLQIHRLDTIKAREERRVKGCDMIDLELQRRAWWYMVASDWLLSFSGGPQEGAYTFQSKHMNVNLPSNTDDELITTSGILQEFPLSVPTTISAFFARVRCSELCRDVIDALPSIMLEPQDTDYETILELDAKFQKHMNDLPFFFKLDQANMEKSRQICKERPYIAWQRVSIHFSLHTRLCRLHRQYHLEGITNPKYAYSHKICIQSAQKVLELRRLMDETSDAVGLSPARFWTVMHHLFFAALILAMDVSFNPHAPDAESRKTKVLAAYQTLEKSKQDSNNLMEGIQKNLQTLMSTLHKARPQVPGPVSGVAQGDVFAETGQGADRLGESSTTHEGGSMTGVQPSSILTTGDRGFDLGMVNDLDEEGWEQLWSEFVAVAPELDVPQWSSLLEDVDFTAQLDAY